MASISACALPPTAGVNVSCDMNIIDLVYSSLSRPKRFSALSTMFLNTSPMCPTSIRVPWKALLPKNVPRISACPARPRFLTRSPLSTTIAAAPLPIIVPLRSASKGLAASKTLFFIVAAPIARNPAWSHWPSLSESVTSLPMTTTRSHLPVLIQSSAIAIPCVTEAHAAFDCVFGPFALINCANWGAPIYPIFKMKFLLKTYSPSAPCFFRLKYQSVICFFTSSSEVFSIMK